MLKKTFLAALIFGLALGSLMPFSVRAEQITPETPKVTSTAGEIAISNVAVSDLTATSATITWTSSAAGDSQIRYSATSKELTDVVWNKTEFYPEGRTSHTINLKGLKPSTNYFFQAKTANTSAGEAISSTGSFFTLTEEKPDLTITDIYFSPNTPTTGEQFTGEVKVKVKNQGAGAVAVTARGVPVIITINDAKTDTDSGWANAGFY